MTGAGLEVELDEQLAAASSGFVATQTSGSPEEDEVLVDPQGLEERGVLWAVPDAAVDADDAGVGAHQTGADPQQRGLAGPVLTDQRHRLAAADVEVDRLEDTVVTEPLRDPADRQRRRSRHDRRIRSRAGHDTRRRTSSSVRLPGAAWDRASSFASRCSASFTGVATP